MEETSVILATRAQVAAIDLEAALLPQLAPFDAVEMKWLDPVKLARLEEVLGGSPTMKIIDQLSSELLAISDDGEACIQVVRPELTRLLAAVDDSNVRDIGRRWGATEELSLYPLDVEWLLAFVTAFVRIARQAVTGERELFQVFY